MGIEEKAEKLTNSMTHFQTWAVPSGPLCRVQPPGHFSVRDYEGHSMSRKRVTIISTQQLSTSEACTLQDPAIANTCPWILRVYYRLGVQTKGLHSN